MRQNKNKQQINKLNVLLNEIFGKNKKVKNIVGDTIYTENSTYNFDIAYNTDFDKDELIYTCSMVELTGSEDFDDQIENLFYDLSGDYIRVSMTNMLRITQLLFEEWCENNMKYNSAAIFNVVKEGWMQLTLAKCKSWKKVFEYEGNDGTICTYMYKNIK